MSVKRKTLQKAVCNFLLLLANVFEEIIFELLLSNPMEAIPGASMKSSELINQTNTQRDIRVTTHTSNILF